MNWKKCKLEQDGEYMDAYIPEKYAILSGSARVRGVEGSWVVDEIYEDTITDEEYSTNVKVSGSDFK